MSIVTDGVKEIAKSAAHGISGAIIKLADAAENAHQKKMEMIHEEFPDAVLITENIRRKIKSHALTVDEVVIEIDYSNENLEIIYTVVGVAEAPLHKMTLYHHKKKVGSVIEALYKGKLDAKNL